MVTSENLYGLISSQNYKRIYICRCLIYIVVLTIFPVDTLRPLNVILTSVEHSDVKMTSFQRRNNAYDGLGCTTKIKLFFSSSIRTGPISHESDMVKLLEHVSVKYFKFKFSKIEE